MPLLSSEPLPIWTGTPPNAQGTAPDRDVPTVAPFIPKNCNGAAVVVCTGIGYADLASHEGMDYALWLNERGIAAFLLKYRLGSHGYRYPAITSDITRAIRFVRAFAPGWGLDSQRIGVMGASAGGHLAAVALTRFDGGKARKADPIGATNSRPDFGILCYPVISMGAIGHHAARRNLMGAAPSKQRIKLLSNEFHVSAETPPCFIWHAQDDEVVSVRNSLTFAAALCRRDIPLSLHIYPKGKHGMGLGVRNYRQNEKRMVHPWTRDLETWLQNCGISNY